MKHKWVAGNLDLPGATGRRVSVTHGSGRGATFKRYMAMQKLKKAALVNIASNLTKEEVGTLEDIFRSIDKDGDGTMTLMDLNEALARGTTHGRMQRCLANGKGQMMGCFFGLHTVLSLTLFVSLSISICLTNKFCCIPAKSIVCFPIENFPVQLREDLQDLREDLSVSGVDKIKWKEFLAATMDKSLAIREDKVALAFDHFKRSNSKTLQMHDLVDVLGGESQAKEMIGFVDSDGDGKISFEDFYNAIKESVEEDY